MLDKTERKPGRPPPFHDAKKIAMQKVHLNIAVDVWNALRNYARTIDELSMSRVVRTLLRERLKQLGYLKEEP